MVRISRHSQDVTRKKAYQVEAVNVAGIELGLVLQSDN